MDREIVVQGGAEVRVAPDRAIVHVTLDADASTREDAYRAATESAARIDAVLAGHEDAIERTVTAALAVFPLSRWRKGESVRTGWRAARRSLIEITGFEALGVLLAELATAGGTIAGPDWQVDPTNDAYDLVRQAAAQDARRRATSYATGLGMPICEVNWIAEPGLRTAAVPMARAMLLGASGGAMAEDGVIDVSPADVVISAAVDVSFALAESDGD